MPWTNPETFTAGQTLTAASMNAMSGNVDFLRDGRPAGVRPAVRANVSGSTSLTNGNLVKIAYGAADSYDTDAMHDTVTNNTRITIKTAGLYLLHSKLTVTGTPLNYQEHVLIVNNTTRIHQNGYGGTLSGATTATALYSFALNDYIEVAYYHTTGTSLGVNTSADQTFFSATYIGATP
jgi:hypothetical protein